MEKIDRNKMDKETWVIPGGDHLVSQQAAYWTYELLDKQDEIIDYLSLLDKLAIRVARLEVYYKAHRKEHKKHLK